MNENLKSQSSFNLPMDLFQFLSDRKQLEYDGDLCEAGEIVLLPLENLKVEFFPVETSGLEIFNEDPHYPGVNSYLVEGVNLVASCTGDYEPEGLIIWLPIEERYAIWDNSHCRIMVFGSAVTWEEIAASPAIYINAGWCDNSDPDLSMTYLVPWLQHRYSDSQVYEPQSI
jgi:hypothetical protein